MARVRLASWCDGNPPGAVIEVADDLVGPLTKDGRIAEVLPAATPQPAAEPPHEAEPAEDLPEAEPEPTMKTQPRRAGRKGAG